MEVLLINACVRKKSRTIKLARKLAAKIGGNTTEVFLEKDRVNPLYGLPLVDREILLDAGELWDDMFDNARQFAEADVIIFAAPNWDLSFPAILKMYLESVNVWNIAFEHGEDGQIHGLCKAKKIFYVTTSSNYISTETYGYGYIRELAHTFWGVQDTQMVKAEWLDEKGADPDQIMDAVIARVDVSRLKKMK